MDMYTVEWLKEKTVIPKIGADIEDLKVSYTAAKKMLICNCFTKSLAVSLKRKSSIHYSYHKQSNS